MLIDNRHSDYNPRLAFKDDTSRIVERMQEVSKTGSIVWDRMKVLYCMKYYADIFQLIPLDPNRVGNYWRIRSLLFAL
jgi:hypothetical protein